MASTAHITSSLWSSLFIDLLNYEQWPSPYPNSASLNAMLDHHLKLSRNFPLHISLILPESNEDTRYVLKTLSACSARWASLYLDTDWDLLRDCDFRRVANNLPLLKQLWIEGFTSSLSQEITGPFQSAPILTELSIQGHRPPSPSSDARLCFPWNQLANLTLRHCLTSTALQYLELASQARQIALLRCSNNDFRARPGQYPRVIRCHRLLQSLCITIDDRDPELSVIFNHLTLPSLTDLQIAGFVDEDEDNIDGPPSSENFFFTSEQGAITSFFARSECRLTSLSLKNLPLHDIEIISFLQQIPSLTVLTIHEQLDKDEYDATSFTSHFFECLTIGYTEPTCTLLPRLAELDLRYDVSSFPTSDFLRMIQSRWIPDAAYAAQLGVDSLTSVTLRPQKHQDGKNVELGLDSLKALHVAGLCVSVS
ncbi:hypothetical protein D9758_012730 [Tetrapyrgos nigripes]|uniref:F-box domain-containing protein n=1 Tax=Tetrapyrgos nigripes TaxID=182062 RepID=A0A8H5FTW3_9AGAR|nr:hypothetical protein D9758_012730 [Tetrapyrgos nigripes]